MAIFEPDLRTRQIVYTTATHLNYSVFTSESFDEAEATISTFNPQVIFSGTKYREKFSSRLNQILGLNSKVDYIALLADAEPNRELDDITDRYISLQNPCKYPKFTRYFLIGALK